MGQQVACPSGCAFLEFGVRVGLWAQPFSSVGVVFCFLAVVGAPVRVLLLWDGKGSAVHVAMQRAAMADAARFVGHCTAVHFLPYLGA